MIFHILKIRFKATQNSRVKLLEEVSRHPRSSAEGQSDMEKIMVPSPDGEYEDGCDKAILNFDLKRL